MRVKEQFNYSSKSSEGPFKIELELKLSFTTEKLKVVKQYKADTITSLVAEAGGYVGMFLGYSLLQIPGFLVTVAQALSLLLESYKSKLI